MDLLCFRSAAVAALGLVSSAAAQDSPYPASPVFRGIELDWSTHWRGAPGSDNFQLAWAEDGYLYGAWGDGGGFGGTNQVGRVCLGVARVEGDPASGIVGTNLWGGHGSLVPATFDGKSWGMIAVGQTLYLWVVPDAPEGKPYRNHYEYIELARSTDSGLSWEKAGWRFTEAEALTVPTFLNFGRGNSGVPDGFEPTYVYSYFVAPEDRAMEQEGPEARGLVVHRPGRIFLARAPAEKLFDGRDEFEFFAGFGPGEPGTPQWGGVAEKVPVFEDPGGAGWCVSACYHPASGRVLLATQHGADSQGTLGLFDAPDPWGPWTTVEYFTAEEPFGAERPGSTLPWANNVFFFSFPTKWFDGDRFGLAFTGAGRGKDNDSFNVVRGRFLRAK